MITMIQAGLFVARLALVLKVAMQGTLFGWAVAALGVSALVTTIIAWCNGKPDQTWRGCFVGLAYLVVCAMAPGPLTGGLAVVFWSCVALELSARWTLGKRCTITGPVFVSVVDGWPYNMVRHPMMLADWGLAGVFLWSAPTEWNAWAFVAVSICNGVSVACEESFLGAQPGYASYAAVTRWRVLPGVW